MPTRRDSKDSTLSARTHPEKAMGGHSEKVAVYKPGKEASPETYPSSSLYDEMS